MSTESLPQAWRDALDGKGVTSIRGLSQKAGISPMAASRVVKGEGTSPGTVNAIADALFGGDRNRVWQLHGSEVRDHGDWTPPEEASLLTAEQRDAVTRVIRAMLPGQIRGGGAGRPRSQPDRPPVGRRQAELDAAVRIGTEMRRAAPAKPPRRDTRQDHSGS